ncbi:MAG: hypothetical protein RLZ98_530 [Pseudomonadota bacterium]|jgi:histidinol-phosphate aminotransferase
MADNSFSCIVRDLPATVPFVGPEAIERRRGRPFAARLGANESVFGPSPRVVEAIGNAAAEIWKYGDPENFELKAALAAFHGIAPANIAVGEGVDALLGYAVRLFADPQDTIVSSLGGYPTFNYHVAGYGCRLVTVPYRDDREDPVALIETARRERARIVYLANPDNPMGTWHDATIVEGMMGLVPEGMTMILDEAYADTAPRGAIPVLDVSNPGVVRFRTFSKAYGLAGIRVGYAIGEAGVIAAFDKIRNHFAVSRLAQVAALAALADQDYLVGVVRGIESARARIAAIASENGLAAIPSATNFVTVDCQRDGMFARRVLDALIERDIFVRMPSVAPLDRCIRVSVGTGSDLDLLASVLPAALADASRA